MVGYIRAKNPGVAPRDSTLIRPPRLQKIAADVSKPLYISTSALRVEEGTRTRIWRALLSARDPY